MIQFGAHFVTPSHGTSGDMWGSQRQRFREMKSQIGKVMIPVGFGFQPHHVQDLINDGAHTIILRTEDCNISWQKTRDDYLNRGFQEVVRRNPDVRFVFEVGNEPELCGSTEHPYRGIDEYITQARQTGQNLHTIGEPNLEFILSMPVGFDNYRRVVTSPGLLSYYDGIGTHLYGHWRLEDAGGGDWIRIFNDALSRGLNVWLTEVGINDPNTPKEEKGRRIIEYCKTLPNQVKGIVVFTIGWGTSWPQYEVSKKMADAFAEREFYVGEFYHMTGKYVSPIFLNYFHDHGGVRQFGYPMTNQMNEDGRAVQYFERNVMEWHGDNPPEWRILLRRLGAEEFERRYR